jgi:ABC-type phosphate transport system substrate-binding protein
MRNVPKAAGRFRSLASKASARRALTVGGSLVGAVVVAGAFSMPAGATQDTPANNVIIGTGSSTTYSMMQQLDDLFNAAPGCQLFIPFPTTNDPQPLDYSCTTAPTVAANPENPFNDAAVEEPAFGSSNGIQALEDQGPHGATNPSGTTSSTNPIGNVATNENYARSSRALKSSDLQGLNFVAYAEDGVTWFHYTRTGGTKGPATPSASLTNLTQAEVVGIWNGTYTNWDELCNGGPASAGSCPSPATGSPGGDAPIVVFSAQEGSGTQSTWKGYLGFDPSLDTNAVNCFAPKNGTNTCYGPAVIFENEDAQIDTAAFVGGQAAFVGKTNPDWGGVKASTSEIKSDAAFFFSAGKYNASCVPNKGADCGYAPLDGNLNALGSLAGVAPTEVNILDGAFPDDRYLYNVYSNGSNGDIPVATAATLNYVSEIGFLCNPNKGASTNVIDPNTGTAYINEIQSAIETAGFYPLSADAGNGGVNQQPIDENTLAHPASAILNGTAESGFTGVNAGATGSGGSSETFSSYQPYDNFATTGSFGDPSGFCLTYDTDSNGSS